MITGDLSGIRLLLLVIACSLTCCAQDFVSDQWQARLSTMQLYRLSDRPVPSLTISPSRFHPVITWRGVIDREVLEHYSRMGGGNVPKRLGHVIVASIMSLPLNSVAAVQNQPFRPIDRIALRPDQLYYRYRKPWQPGVASLRNSAKRNLVKEFGPDITTFVRSIRAPLF